MSTSLAAAPGGACLHAGRYVTRRVAGSTALEHVAAQPVATCCNLPGVLSRKVCDSSRRRRHRCLHALR